MQFRYYVSCTPSWKSACLLLLSCRKDLPMKHITPYCVAWITALKVEEYKKGSNLWRLSMTYHGIAETYTLKSAAHTKKTIQIKGREL